MSSIELAEKTEDGKYICSKCGRALSGEKFYSTHTGEKPNLCKACMTMHIDNYDESTYVWLLEALDVPYIPGEWARIRDRAYAKDPSKVTGMSVLGKYLSIVKLNQYKQYDWSDSAQACEDFERRNGKLVQSADQHFLDSLKEKYEAGEISEAEYRAYAPEIAATSSNPPPNKDYGAPDPDSATTFFGTDYINEKDLPDPAAGLTEEDKTYLAMKWGRLYRPNEWIELERKYKEMTDSFDISDPDTEGTLILICKNFLKMNQAIDCGDLDGFQKLSRTYDMLRKSAKFTAAQNTEVEEDFLTSVGELVDYCEREGGVIPKFELDEPLDKVDKTIADLKAYNKSLIYSDTTLARQIEDYLSQRQALERQKADREAGILPEVTDADYQERFDQVEDERILDQEVYSEQ